MLRVVRLHVVCCMLHVVCCMLQAVSTAAADSLIYASVDSAAAKHEITTFFDTGKVRRASLMVVAAARGTVGVHCDSIRIGVCGPNVSRAYSVALLAQRTAEPCLAR